jgi:hypothetical protein
MLQSAYVTSHTGADATVKKVRNGSSFIQIKFYRPNWFMRCSFVLRDYFEGSGRIKTSRSSVMAKKKAKKKKSKGM